jgi:hypothetical protein
MQEENRVRIPKELLRKAEKIAKKRGTTVSEILAKDLKKLEVRKMSKTQKNDQGEDEDVCMCEVCNEEVPEDADFCPYCGEEFDDEEDDEEKD